MVASAAGPVGTAWPPQTAGQGRAAADRISPPIRPLDLRYVTVNTAPQDTDERPRKPANFRMASHTDAIIRTLMPGNIGFLGLGSRRFPQ